MFMFLNMLEFCCSLSAYEEKSSQSIKLMVLTLSISVTSYHIVCNNPFSNTQTFNLQLICVNCGTTSQTLLISKLVKVDATGIFIVTLTDSKPNLVGNTTKLNTAAGSLRKHLTNWPQSCNNLIHSTLVRSMYVCTGCNLFLRHGYKSQLSSDWNSKLIWSRSFMPALLSLIQVAEWTFKHQHGWHFIRRGHSRKWSRLP